MKCALAGMHKYSCNDKQKYLLDVAHKITSITVHSIKEAFEMKHIIITSK